MHQDAPNHLLAKLVISCKNKNSQKKQEIRIPLHSAGDGLKEEDYMFSKAVIIIGMLCVTWIVTLLITGRWNKR